MQELGGIPYGRVGDRVMVMAVLRARVLVTGRQAQRTVVAIGQDSRGAPLEEMRGWIMIRGRLMEDLGRRIMGVYSYNYGYDITVASPARSTQIHPITSSAGECQQDTGDTSRSNAAM